MWLSGVKNGYFWSIRSEKWFVYWLTLYSFHSGPWILTLGSGANSGEVPQTQGLQGWHQYTLWQYLQNHLFPNHALLCPLFLSISDPIHQPFLLALSLKYTVYSTASYCESRQVARYEQRTGAGVRWQEVTISCKQQDPWADTGNRNQQTDRKPHILDDKGLHSRQRKVEKGKNLLIQM